MFLADVDVYFYERFYADEYACTISFFFFYYLLWLSLVLCNKEPSANLFFLFVVYSLFYFLYHSNTSVLVVYSYHFTVALIPAISV